MGYLYNGFCYSSIANLIKAVVSYEHAHPVPIFINGSFNHTYTQFYVNNFQVIYQDSTALIVDIYWTVQAYNAAGTLIDNSYPLTHRNFVTCSNPGHPIEDVNITIPQNSITLQTPASLESPSPVDAVTASWMVVAVFAAAWAFKMIKRSL